MTIAKSAVSCVHRMNFIVRVDLHHSGGWHLISLAELRHSLVGLIDVDKLEIPLTRGQRRVKVLVLLIVFTVVTEDEGFITFVGFAFLVFHGLWMSNSVVQLHFIAVQLLAMLADSLDLVRCLQGFEGILSRSQKRKLVNCKRSFIQLHRCLFVLHGE